MSARARQPGAAPAGPLSGVHGAAAQEGRRSGELVLDGGGDLQPHPRPAALARRLHRFSRAGVAFVVGATGGGGGLHQRPAREERGKAGNHLAPQ